MTEVTQMQLMPGVRLTAIHTGKFKSSEIAVSLLTPLNRDHASENALIPLVLRRGSREHLDMREISAALDELYGGSIEPLVAKKGETQCIGFTATFLDDAYALNAEQILKPATRLLGELLLHPRTENGVFYKEYVRSEQENLVDHIRARVNDKRTYAMLRLGQEMCPDEAFGIDKLGDEEHVRAITPDSLWKEYETLLSCAQVEVYYSGSVRPQQVAEALREALSDLPVNEHRLQSPRPALLPARTQVNVVTERLEVTQGKLAMGFRTGGINVWDERYPALLLLNAVFGGTSMSKLFMNVREKLSLCYFASSVLERIKGVFIVSSGIEFDKYEQAKEEILAQLDACRRGEISDDELEGARRIVVTNFRTLLDSQYRMADYWLGQAVADITDTPEEMVARIERVTRSQVVEAAALIELDTIYFLCGKGDAR